VDNPGDQSPYTTKAGKALRTLRELSGQASESHWTQAEFAAALAQRTRRGISGNHVSRWESGRHLFLVDILLAGMEIAGMDIEELGVADTASDPWVAQLERRITQLEKDKRLKKKGYISQVADRPLDDYYTMTETLGLLDIARQTVYDWMRDGVIAGYRLGGETSFLEGGREQATS
jgi:transcriptional regulator with XRE-family HTH domain